jgi:hypothetical protein
VKWKRSFHIANFTFLISAGYDRPDFQPVAVKDQFILGHQIIASDHQVRFDDQVQFPQHLAYALGAFDFDLSLGVAELHEHEAIIEPAGPGLQMLKQMVRLTDSSDCLRPCRRCATLRMQALVRFTASLSYADLP